MIYYIHSATLLKFSFERILFVKFGLLLCWNNNAEIFLYIVKFFCSHKYFVYVVFYIYVDVSLLASPLWSIFSSVASSVKY